MSSERQPNGQFGKGNTQAKGRKKGTRLKYTQYQKMAATHIPAIIEKLCQLAVDGDVVAAKVIFDRSWPVGA
jgi:predicted ester cyclase